MWRKSSSIFYLNDIKNKNENTTIDNIVQKENEEDDDDNDGSKIKKYLCPKHMERNDIVTKILKAIRTDNDDV